MVIAAAKQATLRFLPNTGILSLTMTSVIFFPQALAEPTYSNLVRVATETPILSVTSGLIPWAVPFLVGLGINLSVLHRNLDKSTCTETEEGR